MIGSLVGNFRIVSRLGRGGMGEVFLAEHQQVETRVAIKLLRAEISEDEGEVRRFLNEARAVRDIQHAGIVKIFDVGTHDTGRAYLIMEYLEGETLAARIRRLGRLPPAATIEIMRQVASVLAATHHARIIHRDLKPENIFLVRDRELGERVKVLDFGIAKLATRGTQSHMTQGVLGTPAYMAPEQWGDAAAVDHRADLYSLGCVAFEMAVGRPPYVATSLAQACQMCLHDPVPALRTFAPDAPPVLAQLIERLLAKSPDARPTVDELAAGLATGELPVTRVAATLAPPTPTTVDPVDPMGVTASTVSTVSTVRPAPAPVPLPPSRSRRWVVGGAIAAVLALGVTLGIRAASDRGGPATVLVDDARADASVLVDRTVAVDAPFDTPIDTPLDAPIDTPIDTPLDAPIDSVVAPRPRPLPGVGVVVEAEPETARQSVLRAFQRRAVQLRRCFERSQTTGHLSIKIEIEGGAYQSSEMDSADRTLVICVGELLKQLAFQGATTHAVVRLYHQP